MLNNFLVNICFEDSIQVIVQMQSQQQPLNRGMENVTPDPDLEEVPTPIANPPPLLPSKKRKKTSLFIINSQKSL